MRIDGLFYGQSIDNANLTDILGRLNIGDVVRAQVLELTTNELILKLFDGSTFKASSMVPVDAKSGDFVDFTVKDRNGGQLILETLKNNPMEIKSEDNLVKKQLDELGIKPNSQNLEIAKEMKNHNIPLEKESFDRIAAALVKLKDLTPAKAAFLTGSNINLERESVVELNNLLNPRNKIGVQLNELIRLLEITEKENQAGGVDKTLTNYSKGSVNSSGNIIYMAKDTDEALGNVSYPQKDGISQTTEIIDKQLQEIIKTVPGNIKTSENVGEKLFKFLTASKDRLKPSDTSLAGFLKNEIINFDELSNKDQQRLFSFVKSLSSRVLEEEPQMENNIAAANHGSRENVQKPDTLMSEALKSLVKKLDSDNQSNEINVKNLYREMLEKLENVKDTISSLGIPSGEDIKNRIENLENSLKFINQLNNHNTYFQIPLRIWNKNTTGDLYVMRRDSRRKIINPDNVTMLVSLTTQNLGRVDSLISMNKKNISINFKVQDEKIFGIIRDSHKELYKSLSELGYKLVDYKYKLSDKEADIVNYMEIFKKEAETGKISIDYRL